MTSKHRVQERQNVSTTFTIEALRMLRDGYVEEAADTLWYAIRIDRYNGIAWHRLALLYRDHLNDPASRARIPKLFVTAMRRRPECPRVRVDFASYLINENQLDMAERLLREALSMEEHPSLTYRLLGTLLKTRGCLEEAEILLRRAVQLRPWDELCVYSLATLLLRLGHREEALESFSIYYDIITKRERERAMQYLKSLTSRMSGDNVGMWRRLLFDHAEHHQLDEKADVLRMAISVKGDDAGLWSDLSIVERELGHETVADWALDTAAMIDPDDERVIFETAQFYRRRGMWEPAEQLLLKYLDICPYDEEARSILAMVQQEIEAELVEDITKELGDTPAEEY